MRARLRLIRHGEAAPARPGESDPGLSVRGVHQALALPASLTERPDQLVTSPLIRARETALPLAAAFKLERCVEPGYGELPWREGQTAVERTQELNVALKMAWSGLDPTWRRWRSQLIDRALSETGDIVIVSHFVAINVLVGHARADDRAVVVQPANASITELHVSRDGIRVIALGEMTTAFADPHLSLAGGPSR